ncbi:MAG: hypothetical protein D6752_06865 [Candidatus Nitrosothermus koennekii]|nr:MAG: hypothetical protein D6752_06865 [Candidatus Nitrosothermus koennekii]
MNLDVKERLKIVRYTFSINQYRISAILSAILYSIFFMLFTGIITISNKPIPDEVPVPYLNIITRIQNLDSIDYTFWIVAYPNRYTVFSMNIEAMLSLLALSSLLAISIALMLYSRNLSKHYECNCHMNKKGLVGIIPATFSVFSCCGGGLILALFGPSLLLTLQGIGSYLTIIGIIMLVSNILLTTNKIKNIVKH